MSSEGALADDRRETRKPRATDMSEGVRRAGLVRHQSLSSGSRDRAAFMSPYGQPNRARYSVECRKALMLSL
jgi:hypothetical protein